jgi:dephospho-CoA kinase
VTSAIPVIGLTGAIAAGKSEALAALRRLGAETISSDAIVHELLESEDVRRTLVDRWGEEVAPDGAVDRARVGAIVFADPEELRWLEATLHPLVGARTAAWRETLPAETKVAVLEVPLLFETGMESLFDATICVVAPAEVRAQRAGARGTSELAAREARQLSQEEKAARATYVVRNQGSLDELESELAAILSDIGATTREESD